METLSFAFGMLTMIGVALAAVVVVGIVKVFRMQSTLKSTQEWIVENHNHVLQRISTDVTNIENVITNDRREMNQRIDECYRYTDSRFDKFENKLNGNSAKKQIIND